MNAARRKKETRNFKESTLYVGEDCDNLRVMRGMNSACFDLIYLDPPFNSKRDYEAPIGSEAEGTGFKDTWSMDDIKVEEHGELADKHPALYQIIAAAKVTHSEGAAGYLIFMALRLMEMRRILKDTGSVYLHCDPTMSHYLKLLMDAVFGRRNFRNELVWSHQGSWIQPESRYPRRHDTLLYYAADNSVFNVLHEDNYQEQMNYKRWRKYAKDGKIYGDNAPYHDTRFHTYVERFENTHGRKPRPRDVVYEFKGSRVGTVQYLKVVDPKSKERTGYATQKPLSLLHRVIEASSNPGDWVFDPFCGCATAMVAAETAKSGARKWVGCDLGPKAAELMKFRLEQAHGLGLSGSAKVNVLRAPPRRTDSGEELAPRDYRKHGHLLYGQQEGVCKGCGYHYRYKDMEIDHILPRAKGGASRADNLQLLCGHCNRSKGDKTMAEWNAAKKKA